MPDNVSGLSGTQDLVMVSSETENPHLPNNYGDFELFFFSNKLLCYEKCQHEKCQGINEYCHFCLKICLTCDRDRLNRILSVFDIAS
jgi:hypothetical protein